MAYIKRKVNSTLRTLLSFEPEEWSQIDFEETPVRGMIRQYDVEVPATVILDEENYQVYIDFNLEGFDPGSAAFDVWIGNTPIPQGYNIKVDLIEGVSG